MSIVNDPSSALFRIEVERFLSSGGFSRRSEIGLHL